MTRTFKAAVLASGNVLTSLVTLVVFVVLSRVFDERDYSTYRKALLAYQFVAPVLMLGLPSALYYFLPRSDGELRGKLLENLVLLGTMGGVFTLFLVCGGNRLLAFYFKNPELEKALLVLAPYPLLLLPTSALAACLISRDRVKQVAFYQIGSQLVFLFAVLVSVAWFATPVAALWGMVIAAAIALAPALWLMLRVCPGAFSISWKGMVEQMRYSVPLGLGSTLNLLNRQVTILIVAGAVTDEAFAIFINGAMEIPLIGIITGSASAVLLPDLTSKFNKGDPEGCVRLWRRSALKAGIILLPATGFLMATAPDLMEILYSDKYRDSSTVFRVFLILLPIRVVFFGVIFQASGNSRIVLQRATIAFLINLTLAYGFVIVMGYGYFGAVVAMILTIYFYAVPFNLLKIREITAHPIRDLLPYKILLKIALVSAIASIPAWFTALLPVPPALRLGFSACTFAICLILGMKFAGVTIFHQEMSQLWRKIRGIG